MGWRGRDHLGDCWDWPRALWAVGSSDARERQSWLIIVGAAGKYICHQQAQSTRGGRNSQGGPTGTAGEQKGSMSLWKSGRRQRWNKQVAKVREIWKQESIMGTELGFRARGLTKTRLDLIKLFPLCLRLFSFALPPPS